MTAAVKEECNASANTRLQKQQDSIVLAKYLKEKTLSAEKGLTLNTRAESVDTKHSV